MRPVCRLWSVIRSDHSGRGCCGHLVRCTLGAAANGTAVTLGSINSAFPCLAVPRNGSLRSRTRIFQTIVSMTTKLFQPLGLKLLHLRGLPPAHVLVAPYGHALALDRTAGYQSQAPLLLVDPVGKTSLVVVTVRQAMGLPASPMHLGFCAKSADLQGHACTTDGASPCGCRLRRGCPEASGDVSGERRKISKQVSARARSRTRAGREPDAELTQSSEWANRTRVPGK